MCSIVCQHAIIQAGALNMQVVRYQSVSQDKPDSDMVTALHNVTTGGIRIVMVAATGDAQTSLMIRAAEMGLLNDDYVWLMMNNYASDLSAAVNARNANLSSLAGLDTEYDKPNTAINATTVMDYNSTFTGLFMFDNWLSLYGYPPFEKFLDSWSQLDPSA